MSFKRTLTGKEKAKEIQSSGDKLMLNFLVQVKVVIPVQFLHTQTLFSLQFFLGTWTWLLLLVCICFCLIDAEISLTFFLVSLSGYQQFLCLSLTRTHFHWSLLGRSSFLSLSSNSLFSKHLMSFCFFWAFVLDFYLCSSSSSSYLFGSPTPPITNSLNPEHTHCLTHPPTWTLKKAS